MQPAFFLRNRWAVVSCLLGVGGLLFTGCRPEMPWDVVRAKTDMDFQMWRASAFHKMTPEQRAELDTLVDELRFARPGLTKQDVYEQIDQKRLPDVIRLGYEARVNRLGPLWLELKAAIDSNALLIPKPGDEESPAELRRRQREQQARLEKMGAQIDEAEQRVATLTGKPYVSRQRDTRPLVLPRAEALREIEGLIARRRLAATQKYGEWPVSIDITGLGLEEGVRNDFERRKAKAERENRVALAVRVRDKWWIYDAPKEAPDFPPALVGNLTEVDRKTMELKWMALMAETWARAESWEENRATGNPAKPPGKSAPRAANSEPERVR